MLKHESVVNYYIFREVFLVALNREYVNALLLDNDFVELNEAEPKVIQKSSKNVQRLIYFR